MLETTVRPAIEISDLVVAFDSRPVIAGLSLRVARGEIVALIGASGSGKTVLLRSMLGLLPKRAGSIEVMGVQLEDAAGETAHAVGARSGVLFQQGALFSSLTVRENIEFPMREYLRGSRRAFSEIAIAKLQMVGLSPNDGDKLPAQLSGGMTKRAALARALALDPEILFLDEPTSGLDPIAASAFDSLIQTLHQTLKLTVFMITHDVVSMRSVCERILALRDGKIIADGPMSAMLSSENSWLEAYFHGEREQGRQAPG